MSTVERTQSEATLGKSTAFTVTWPITRRAVRAACPELCDVLPAGHGSRRADMLLCVSVDGARCTAELRDEASGTTRPIEIGRVAIDVIESAGFRHVDATDNGQPILSVTIRTAADGARLLYARTTLLDRLGIRGGRYGRPVLG